MSQQFSAIHIICNPNSTGPSVKLARSLQKELHNVYSLKSEIHKTEHAGHAEELAYKFAHKSDRPLIVSSSGDGGYHEVVNGAMKAIQEGRHPICVVLPAGNANDHARSVGVDSIAQSIAKGELRRLDVLQLTVNADMPFERYAHSYIGFGLTPAVAVELNKTDLNMFKEIFIVAKNILTNRPFHIRHKDKSVGLDSLVFSNIGEMAKILTFAKNAEPDDGKFEVTIFPHRGKSDLIRRLWRATRGIEQSKHFSEFTFELDDATHVQLDGEVRSVEARAKITVSCLKRAYETIA